MVTRLEVFRSSSADAWLVVASLGYGTALLTFPSIPLIAIGFWWTANTVAHNFIHHPFFRVRQANRIYSIYLSLILGVPQTLWRDRHLAHHANRSWRLRLTPDLVLEQGFVLLLWIALGIVAPTGFLLTYLPGLAIGMLLAHLQGHYEHVHGTTSHYGRLYNLLFFNDGFHVEHHARPAMHWSELSSCPHAPRSSRWPPVLRWLDAWTLTGLERVVLRSRTLQRFVVAVHRKAFLTLLRTVDTPRTVTIVGGGLFPRTALVLRELLPDASLTIVDADATHLEVARAFLGDSVPLVHETFEPKLPSSADLVVLPLAFCGNRQDLYERPPARYVAVHDWIWRPRGRSVAVSVLLLKRLNLVPG